MFVNLTPHTINVLDESEQEVLAIGPSGTIARVSVEYVLDDKVDGVPIYTAAYGEVTGLPEPAAGTLYIVSGLVNTCVDRRDVLSPGELVRNDDGRPVGCKGLKE